jgi:FtsZ-interacting cell division protein YlmF
MSYIKGEARDARERWFHMVEWEKREEKKKEEQKEMRHRQEMRECEAAQAREANRERKRERARQAKAVGPDATGRENTPVVLSRPRVLLVGLYQIILDFMTSSTRVLGSYS